MVPSTVWKPTFLANFLIADEGGIALNGKFNTWNIGEHVLIGNPPSSDYDRPKACQKLKVWTKLCGNDQVLMPFFSDTNVTEYSYLEIINMEIFPFLVLFFSHHFQDGEFQRLYWAQDSALTYQRIIVRYGVSHVLQNRVVALFRDNEWWPRSPDFLLWRNINDRVYSSTTPNLNKLRRQIIDNSWFLTKLDFLRNVVMAVGTRVNSRKIELRPQTSSE